MPTGSGEPLCTRPPTRTRVSWRRSRRPRGLDVAKERMSPGDLLLLTATLAVFGIATSAYLTWQWYEAANRTWCDLDAFFSCTKVRESPFSAVAGLPTAFVGVAGFGILPALPGVSLPG